jgi:hypothetical protein
MCDYSLHTFASRPAKVGDELVTTKFSSFTRGLATPAEPDVAVCLLPGTELVFAEEAEIDHPFGRLFPNSRFGKIGDKVARFRHINGGPDLHRDALEFANGKIVLLTRLRPGQRVTILQLPARARRISEADELTRVSLAPDLLR